MNPRRIGWWRFSASLIVAVALPILAACASQPTASTSPTPTSGGPAPNASSSATSSKATGTPSHDPSQIDFCTLLTAQEASQLAGFTLHHTQGGGVGNGNVPCVYSDGVAKSVAVKLTTVPAGTDVTAIYQQGLQLARQKGLTVTELSGLGDSAAMVCLTPAQDACAAIYVVKGSVVLYIVTTELPLPGSSAVQAAAMLAVGRF